MYITHLRMHASRLFARVPTCHALYRSCDVYSFIHTESHSLHMTHCHLVSQSMEGARARAHARAAQRWPPSRRSACWAARLPHGPIRPCDEQLHHRGSELSVATVGKALPAGEEAEDRSASCGGARRGGHRRGRVARRAARPVSWAALLPARDVVHQGQGGRAPSRGEGWARVSTRAGRGGLG